MLDLNEFQTRRQKIDLFLERSGWNVEDKTKVLVEIDTKQSDFITQEYRTVSDTLRNSLESRYLDYLLLDQWGKPLAIIEAKRTCKDPLITAPTQASQYADDIKAQTGEDVFIYLSNGYEIWFWNRPHQPQRPVKRFHTRENLEKMKWQNRRKQSLLDLEIKTEIVDRPKSIECAKRVLERFDKGHRKALVVMATGTGKTRVAMAIIDVLMRASWVKRALFIADRKALRNQAYNKGFKQFFPHEAKTKVFSGEVEKEARLYAATIQTMQECYQEFSPGFFDLIISDEAHRSIFNKWKDIFTYFDSLQIGLTATPADFIERSSFRFFECDENTPVALYDYRDAVEDGILCDFRSHIMSSQAHFQIDGLTKDDIPNDELLRILEQNVNPDEINFEGTDFEKKFVTMGTNEALVKEFFDYCLMDESGTLPAKTIFFAISMKHAKRLLQAINRLRPEYGGELARVIVSEDSRAQDSIKEFTDKSFPRIAISVDMLDTGIDVPEVCNLVFAKPVFSYIKFWQMIGRGTRSNKTCDHHEWLPNGKKEHFKIFDFWNNFEFFKMKPEGDTPDVAEAITNRIFRTRLAQLKYFMDRGDTEKAEEVKRKILDDIKSLPMDSIGIQDSMSMVEKALSPNLWESYAIDPIDFLHKNIAPLMRYKPNVNLSVAFFTNKVERLAVAILNSREEDAENLKKSIATDLECLPTNLTVVQDKIELLDEAKSRTFWNRVAYEDTQMLIREFAELMKYKKAEPQNPIIIDIGDVIEKREFITFGVDGELVHVKEFREKIEARIKELADGHPTIQKILGGEVITEEDVEELEETLNGDDLTLSDDVLKQFYTGTFVNFIKEIFGLYKEQTPEETIDEAFNTFLVENNKQYNADQFNFIRTIKSVFMKKKHIEFSDLFEPPFSNFGIHAPVPLFQKEELGGWMDFFGELESEVFM